MSVTIYHNPRCSKSRQTLALLNERGQDVEVVEYLKSPPDAAALVAAMVENPILIERPIVVAGNRVALGRPPAAVLEIL